MYPPESQPNRGSPPLPPASQPPPCSQLPPSAQYQRPRHPYPPAFEPSPTPQRYYPHSRTPWSTKGHQTRSPSPSYESPPSIAPPQLHYPHHYPPHSSSRYMTPNPDMWAPTAPCHPPRPTRHSSRRPEEAYHIDHYRPPRPSTPKTHQQRALPTPGDSGGSASPRSGSQVYMQSTKGKAPVTTMGNKLLNKLDDILKQLEASNDRMQALEESNTRNRDQLHDLHVIVKSLPTKADITEDLDTQRELERLFSTAIQEQMSTLMEKLLPAISSVPTQIRASLLDDIRAEREAQEPSHAISTAIAPVLEVLDDLAELRGVLTALKDLPNAVTAISAFQEVFQSLSSKVAGMAECIEVSAPSNATKAAPQALAQSDFPRPISLDESLDTLSSALEDIAQKVDSIQERVQGPNLLDFHTDNFQMLADSLKDLAAQKQSPASPSQVQASELATPPKRPLPHDTSSASHISEHLAESQANPAVGQTAGDDSLESRSDKTRRSAKKQKTSHGYHPDPPMTRKRSAQLQKTPAKSSNSPNPPARLSGLAFELRNLAKDNAFHGLMPDDQGATEVPPTTTSGVGKTSVSASGKPMKSLTPSNHAQVPITNRNVAEGTTAETAIPFLVDTSSEGSIDRSLDSPKGRAVASTPVLKTYKAGRRSPTSNSAKSLKGKPAQRGCLPMVTDNDKPRKSRKRQTPTSKTPGAPASQSQPLQSNLDPWLQTTGPAVHPSASRSEKDSNWYESLSPTQRTQDASGNKDSQDGGSDESRITPLWEALDKAKKKGNLKSLFNADVQSQRSPTQTQRYTFAPDTYVSSIQTQQFQVTQMSPNEAGGQGGFYWSRSNSATSGSQSPQWNRQRVGKQRDDLYSQFVRR